MFYRICRLSWFVVLSCLIILIVSTSNLAAQPVGSANESSQLAYSHRQIQLPKGGGSLADFTELINLIQNTVKGNWDANGGEDTIQTSSSGVWLDPKGKLIRRQKAETKLPVPAAEAISAPVIEIPLLANLAGDDQTRWVSLGDLESTLRDLIDRKEKGSTATQLLGGITRLDFVAYDPAGKCWMIGGPAGDLVLDKDGSLIGRNTGLPPLLLEDLLSVAPLVLNGKGPVGCSIDPLPERLKAVTELSISPIARKSMIRQASQWCERLAETLGDQKATVFGLPEDSPTATALLIADEHMKRVGLGLANGPAKLMSYWEEAEKRGHVPNSTLIRWWFAFREDIQIGVDDKQKIFALESPTIQVLSQHQWMDQTGQRHDSRNQKDAAADAFAWGFTQRFDELQRMYPSIYGRMRHISDLCVALQVIREETMSQGIAPLTLLTDKSLQPRSPVALKWIPSLAAWRKTSSGTVAAVVSGGVSLDTKRAKLRKQPLTKNVSPRRPFDIR